MSLKSEAAGRIAQTVGRKTLDKGLKGAADAVVKKSAAAAKVLAKDSVAIPTVKLSASVAGLVDLAKMTAGSGDEAASKKAFVDAAIAAQGITTATDKGLGETLQVARIAQATPNSSDAASTILANAVARFRTYDQRIQLATAAQQIGATDVHLDIMKGLTSYPPSTAAAIDLAKALQPLSLTEKAYKPLVSNALEQGLRVTTNAGEALQLATAAHGVTHDATLYSDAIGVYNRLGELGLMDAGNHRDVVQEVLREQGRQL